MQDFSASLFLRLVFRKWREFQFDSRGLGAIL